MDPRTPVLVGVHAVQQRCEHPDEGLEPVELMIAALEGAAEDAGNPSLLGLADAVRVPRGFWDYSDPARLIASRMGATGARTQLAEIGILQTTVLARAAADILAGKAELVLVAGGEAKHRNQLASRLGTTEFRTEQVGVAPDEVLEPHQEIVHPRELELGIAMPVNQYAVVENALRAADGIGIDAHRDEVASLWAGMSEVAAGNPDAWNREPLDAATIRDPGPGNRWVAFPYTKHHNSQWNVDQAAGLILTSVGMAQRLGLDPERFVFPLAAAESNHMVSLAERRAIGRVPGFACAREVIEAHLERPLASLDRCELYSCFPSAVRVQQRELALDRSRPVTVTGGMAFAGGPLNNFVLQSIVRLAQGLRAAPGETAMANAVSGFLTKQGVSVWASKEPTRPFLHADVSDATARALETCEVVDAADGEGRLASYTVQYDGETPTRSVLFLDLDDGRRVLRADDDPALAASLTREEWIGRRLPARA